MFFFPFPTWGEIVRAVAAVVLLVGVPLVLLFCGEGGV